MTAKFEISVLENWNDKETESLKKFFAMHQSNEAFFEFLIAQTSNALTQSAATWLLKHALERGIQLTPESQASLYRSLTDLETWPAQLHVLQCLPRLEIPSRNKKQVERFVRVCSQSDNKFVRTWSLAGLSRLAQFHVEYRAEAERILHEAAEKGETASLRARARQLLKNSKRNI